MLAEVEILVIAVDGVSKSLFRFFGSGVRRGESSISCDCVEFPLRVLSLESSCLMKSSTGRPLAEKLRIDAANDLVCRRGSEATSAAVFTIFAVSCDTRDVLMFD